MLGKYFLTPAQQKKAHFLFEMNHHEPGNYSINALSQQFDSAYQPFLQMIKELNEELVTLHLLPILEEQNQVIWRQDVSIYNTYMVSELNHSLSYRFLLWTLLYPERKVTDFCEEHFISRSTIMRHLRPLKAYLEQYNLTLNPANMSIIGDEMIIRLFYIRILWFCSLGHDIEDASHSFLKEKAILSSLRAQLPNHLNSEIILLMLEVCRLRNEQKNYLPNLPFDHLVMPASSQIISDYLSEFLDIPLQIKRNTEFINYLIHYYPYAIEDSECPKASIRLYYDKKIAIGDPLFVAIENFYAFGLELLQSHQLELTKSVKMNLLHNIITTFLNYSLQKGKVPLIFESIAEDEYKNNEIYQQLVVPVKNKINQLSRRKKMNWLTSVKPSITHSLTLNLFSSFQAQLSKAPIKIGLVVLPNSIQMQEIYSFLDTLSFVELCFVSKKEEIVDAYITAFPALVPDSKKPIFRLKVNYDDFEVELLRFLLEVKREKVNYFR